MQQKTKLICKHLREHAMKIFDYEEKKMIPLTDEKISHMQSKKFVTYVKKNLVLMIMMMMIKSVTKKEIIVITLENLEELLIVFPI